MLSMADFMRKYAWVLTVGGWFLSPIISLLVNKIFAYLVFDTSKKLKQLETEIIRKLKQTLGAVEEQTVLRAAQDNPSESDLKILDNMKMDLKSALYEAEDILDLVDYRRIENGLHHGDDDSVWVENQLAAACAWIARCKGSCFGRWIHVTLAAVMKKAQSMTSQEQFLIQGWRHWRPNFDLFCSPRAVNIAGAAVLQSVQSWCQQLQQRFWSDVLQCAQRRFQRTNRSGSLLPVSHPEPQPRGSMFVPADPTSRPAEEMVDEEEIMEETQVVEGEAEIEEELEEIENGEEGEIPEEIQEGCGEVGETSEEENEYGKEGEEIVEEIRRSGALLPPKPPGFESRGSEFVPADPTRVEGEAAEEVQDGEEGAMLEEIEEESCEGGEEGVTSSEKEIEEESSEGEEVGETSSEEEDDVKRKVGEPIFLYCARPMLTLFAKLYFYRDWPYGIVGIKSKKKDTSAVESLVPITERISLKNRIKRIEDILDTSEKSDLLNDKNSSSGTTNDTDKESSSSTLKNSAKESSSEQKENEQLSRDTEREVFGRDKDRADIYRMLRKEPHTYAASSSTSKHYSVIGIYGITGSGKTTLAQYVCDYEKKAGHFDLIMFIHVGKTFSVGNIFRDMMEQITKSRPANDEDLKSLKTELEKTLKDKCFLLVLDDLWVNDDMHNGWQWDTLLGTLSAARSGSRVLVTAQKEDAAGALGAHLQLFPIPDLKEEVYLSLLMHHAGPFATDDEYRKYENIGSEIANRLCRSPIAAVTVGKRLQRNKSSWNTIAKLEVLNKTMGALWWSYQQLGVDIRRCFAYFSTFPKGYGLKRDKLVRIWIAQGFVNTRSSAREELEDVGQRYCDELLTFSFLQRRRKISWKTEEIITIHDLLHKFAEEVSGSEFFRIGLNDSPEDIPRGVHHLFIETTNGVEIAEKLMEVENLRTLIIKEPFAPRGRRNYGSEKLLERLFMRLTKLRVLIIKQNGFAKRLSVPACIDRMKHLRYLGLRFHHDLSVLILPSTFSKLYHIEIIDIPLDSASCPEDMANLIYLRHIPDRLYFPNIGRLTSLRTMRFFKVEEEQGYGLKQFKHLNKLGGTLIISGLGIVGSKEEALEAHLTHKERLRELRLHFGRVNKRFGPDVEAEVLEGLCPPKDLQELFIEEYRGSGYPSWMLNGLCPPKHLQKLEFWLCSSKLACIPEDSELFIGLRELTIRECDWDRLPENMERLLSLQKLEIFFCDYMELVPKLPVQSLKKIRIIRCEVLSETCKEAGHENWRKIQEIPEKEIR